MARRASSGRLDEDAPATGADEGSLFAAKGGKGKLNLYPIWPYVLTLRRPTLTPSRPHDERRTGRNFKVVVRVRPQVEREIAENYQPCTSVDSNSAITIAKTADVKHYTFVVSRMLMWLMWLMWLSRFSVSHDSRLPCACSSALYQCQRVPVSLGPLTNGVLLVSVECVIRRQGPSTLVPNPCPGASQVGRPAQHGSCRPSPGATSVCV